MTDFLAEIKFWAISRASSLKPWLFADLWNNIYNDPELILETINESQEYHSPVVQKAADYCFEIFVVSKGHLVTFALAADPFQ